jgi:cell division protein FtsA
VTEQDVARVLAACDVPDIGEGREVLHAQPVNFALDHRTGLGDPRGQIGNRWPATCICCRSMTGAVQNLLHCIKRCDLELAGIASSAYVSGISSPGRG